MPELKRILRQFDNVTAQNFFEGFRGAIQDVINAYGKSPEAPSTAFRCCTEMAALMVSSGPPPRFLTEYGCADAI